LIVSGGNGVWPAIVDTGVPMTDCFEEVDIGIPSQAAFAGELAGTRVFRVVCR
jgi:hypothetical protein